MKQFKCVLTMALLAWIARLSQSLHAAATTRTPKLKQPKATKKPKLSKEKSKKQQYQWFITDNEADSCTDKCSSVGSNFACSEQALKGVNSESAVKQIGITTGTTCQDTQYPTYQGPFPMYIGGQCFYSPPNYANSCPWPGGRVLRYCPCFDVTAFGDPHLTNMMGEYFDITREGISTFLRLDPQDKNHSKFRIDALIEHPGEGSRCFGFYIRRVWITGSLVGQPIEVATNGTTVLENESLTIKIGNKVMRNGAEVAAYLDSNPGKYDMTVEDRRSSMQRSQHLNNRIKFATLVVNVKGAEFKISWSTGDKKPNILEINANNLKQLGSNWGGLLANDDHTLVSSYEPTCQKSQNYKKIAQLLSTEPENSTETPIMWLSSASLS